MKILIVDDSRAMRGIVKRSLRQAGFGDWEVQEAENGKAALAQIDAASPDLVLADWNMPEMTGIELLRTLRGEGSRVKLGFVTSESTPAIQKEARDADALFVLSKPFTPDQLREALERTVL